MKRPRDIFDTTSASSSPPMPPSKRQSFLAGPIPPPTFRSAFPVPSSPWASSVPHDSPSNPFGLNRSFKALALPRASGFGKHMVLRMQLVSQIESRSRSRRLTTEAPFRIVQVPLNYSFRLLHELILFLFASDAALRVRRRRRVFSPSLIPHQPPPRTRKPKAELEVFGESPVKEEGHVFEVFDDVHVYALSYRPGVIKAGSGKLYAKLSSARERRLFPASSDDDEEDGDVFGSTAMKLPTSEDEDEWDWEAEDDFMLSNVWTDGIDLKKGIIYHHTPSTSIHITVNQARVAPRKGSGNTPYVFLARGGTNGAVRIANVVPGPMPTDEEIKENMNVSSPSQRKGKKKDAKDKEKEKRSIFTITEDDFEEVDDLDDGEQASTEHLERWNAHDAFQRFLAHEAARERAMRKHLNPAPSSSATTPALGTSHLSRSNVVLGVRSHTPSHVRASRHPFYAQGKGASSSSVSLAPSSPSTLPIVLPSSDFDGDGEAWSDQDFDFERTSEAEPYAHSDPDLDEDADDTARVGAPRGRGRVRARVYEIELPVHTPYPANASVRRRVQRVGRRIERQTSKGLSEMSDDEDDEDQRDELDPSQEKETGEGEEEENTEEDAGGVDDPTVRVQGLAPVFAAKGPVVFEYEDVHGPGDEEDERGLDDEDSDDDGVWEDGSVCFGTWDGDSDEEV